MSKFRRRSGFTLLEAIVAIAILSTSSLAFYAWLNTSLIGMQKVSDLYELQAVARNLEAYFDTTNIQTETEQQLVMSGYQIRWRSTLIEPKATGLHGTGAVGLYDLGLYNVAIEVRKEGRLLGEYQTRLVGHERVREPASL